MGGRTPPLNPPLITYWPICFYRGRRDRMVVGFSTTYAISVYHHWRCEFESRTGRGVQHYVIKFVWLATVWWFSQGPPVSSTNKTDRHDITETINTKKLCFTALVTIFVFVLGCIFCKWVIGWAIVVLRKLRNFSAIPWRQVIWWEPTRLVGFL